jgi:hypothetical protein
MSENLVSCVENANSLVSEADILFKRRPKIIKKRGGRPVGTGIYGESTVLYRIPVSLVPHLDFILQHWKPIKNNPVVPFPQDY